MKRESIKRKTNLELLRIVCMFLILILHAANAFDPWPIDQSKVLQEPLVCFASFFFEALTIVAVNAFVLLSGYFGIKFSFQRLLSFIFQVFFFSVLLMMLPSCGEKGLRQLWDIFTSGQYWYVNAYIILFILSPALNLFAEKASRMTFKDVLLAYFLMQTFF